MSRPRYTYIGMRRRGGADGGAAAGLLALVGADGGGRQVDGVGFGVRPLRASAQLGRQPPAQRRRDAFRLAKPAPTLPYTIGTGIGKFKIKQNKTKTGAPAYCDRILSTINFLSVNLNFFFK